MRPARNYTRENRRVKTNLELSPITSRRGTFSRSNCGLILSCSPRTVPLVNSRELRFRFRCIPSLGGQSADNDGNSVEVIWKFIALYGEGGGLKHPPTRDRVIIYENASLSATHESRRFLSLSFLPSSPLSRFPSLFRSIPPPLSWASLAHTPRSIPRIRAYLRTGEINKPCPGKRV